MAYPVYSTRFLAGVSSSPGTVDSYVVPAGKVAVVRMFTLVDGTAGGTGTTFALTIPGPIFIIIGAATGAVPFLGNDLSVVLNAGETLGVYRAAGTGYYSVSGYLLNAS